MAIPISQTRQITIDDLFGFGKSEIMKLIDRKPHSIQWIEKYFIDPITKQVVELAPHQKRVLRRALQMDEHGYSKYSLVIWSEPKKSGKTTVAAAVGAYIAENIESPNEVSCLANDKEQSAGRIYANMIPTLQKLGWQVPPTERGKRDKPTAFGSNGTIVKAITTDYEKEAGANQGLSLWSELWAYDSERLNRLWEEMTPPPTRKFAMRWVETYAGFLGESKLLWGYYTKIFKNTEENELQDRVIKLWHDLPVYELDERLLVYWSHEHRMPWQTEGYYLDQRSNMRMSSFKRLHLNQWVEAAGDFITQDMWDTSVRGEKPAHQRAVYALDASKNSDCTALVGCFRAKDASGKFTDAVQTADVHIWEPEDGKEVQFSDVEKVILDLYFVKKVMRPPLFYDPYQCVKMAQDLRQKGIPCQEFPQGQQRIKADTMLFKFYKEGTIINYPHPKLRLHVMSAKEKRYDDQKVRIIKPNDEIEDNGEDANQFKPLHVDACVAQSMAAYKAYTKGGEGWGGSGW